MKLPRILKILTLSSAWLLVSFAALNVNADMKMTSMPASKDIVDTAVGSGEFNTLTKALQAADLVKTLKGKGPFTVFAPTDEAFGKLPPGALDELLKNKKKLAAILTYHVVPGSITSEQVVKLKGAKTVNGQRVNISAMNGNVMVDNANVVKVDIKASNGVIHVIDSVMMPKT